MNKKHVRVCVCVWRSVTAPEGASRAKNHQQTTNKQPTSNNVRVIGIARPLDAELGLGRIAIFVGIGRMLAILANVLCPVDNRVATIAIQLLVPVLVEQSRNAFPIVVTGVLRSTTFVQDFTQYAGVTMWTRTMHPINVIGSGKVGVGTRQVRLRRKVRRSVYAGSILLTLQRALLLLLLFLSTCHG